MTTKEYQKSLFHKLRRKFSELEVQDEWRSFTDDPTQYSPRVDIAIGPFNINEGNIKEEYNVLIRKREIKSFILNAHRYHIDNIKGYIPFQSSIEEATQANINARCLFAIEIENSNSKKHLMGSIINAASLGRIGIGIAYNDKSYRTFLRVIKYLGFLTKVEKNSYSTLNFFVLTVEQMETLI